VSQEAPPLLEQLSFGRRLIAPVLEDRAKNLILVETSNTGLKRKGICELMYVSLKGSYGASCLLQCQGLLEAWEEAAPAPRMEWRRLVHGRGGQATHAATVAVANHAIVARDDDFSVWNIRLLIIRTALLLGRKRQESVDQDSERLPVIQLAGLSSPDCEGRLVRETRLVNSSVRT